MRFTTDAFAHVTPAGRNHETNHYKINAWEEHQALAVRALVERGVLDGSLCDLSGSFDPQQIEFWSDGARQQGIRLINYELDNMREASNTRPAPTSLGVVNASIS